MPESLRPGLGQASETSSASARTSVSTRARCTGVVSGTEVRAVPVSCLPTEPRSRWSRLSGSGLSLVTQATRGQPVARLARIRVDFCDGVDDRGHAGGVGERVVERRDPLLRKRRRLGRAGRRVEPAGGALTSASTRARLAFLVATRLAIMLRSSSTPSPCGR